MQLEFVLPRPEAGELRPEPQPVRGRPIPLQFVRNQRARRYILRLQSNGVARVTIPRGGSMEAAREFAQRHTAWLTRQLQARAAQPTRTKTWVPGTEILFRGERVKLDYQLDGRSARVGFADQRVPVPSGITDLRPVVEAHLRRLAVQDLETRVHELNAAYHLPAARVTIRNQRSRWGSCSATGAISLNWRLIQIPPFVRDYIIIHELMHLRHMNHSPRFWRAVAEACPTYPEAQRWLRKHGDLMR